MKPITGTSSKSYPVVPEETYETLVTEVVEVDKPAWMVQTEQTEWLANYPTSPFPDYKLKQYRFRFTIIEGDYKGQTVIKFTNVRLTTHERNGLLRLITKVRPDLDLPALIESGDAPDLETDVVGYPVRCDVEVSANGEKNKVVGFKASKRKVADAKKAAAAIAAERELGATEITGDDPPF